MKSITTAILLLCLGSSAAFAKEKKKKAAPPNAEERFKALDKDGNGMLSLSEFLEGKSDSSAAKAAFRNADTDNDNSLTLEEFSSLPQPDKKERKKDKKRPK